MTTKDCLIEIGTEELPPKSLKKLSQAFTENIEKALKDAGLAFESVKGFATPRRLAVIISKASEKQQDSIVEKRGPALKAAFDEDGNPTKACLGFAKGHGVEVSDLEKLETDKGTWLIYKKQQVGLTFQEVIPELISQALKQLPIAKNMRWGNFETEFVRPVHWTILLYGDDVIDAEILGKKTGKQTFGHRFHCEGPINIKNAKTYQQQLEKEGFVIVDFEKRRELIKQQVEAIAKKNKATAVIEDDLLDEVTAIVEWPNALLGSFDKAFLKVPSQALISEMADHQKYFHCVDKNNNLLPLFITISNIKSKDENKVIVGNERVIRSRLSDAAFFYDTDRKTRLDERLTDLNKVIYQKQLGDLSEKAIRLDTLSAEIAKLIGADVTQAKRAGLLAKCDLVSDMVGEFPKLQGIMGGYYARNDGEADAVADAIKEHYQPTFSGDNIPETVLGSVVSIADKLDTLIGIFGINQKPSGDKDPYSLRRAAIGVVRIITENHFSIDLKALLNKTKQGFKVTLENKTVVDDVHHFMIERLKRYHLDKGYSIDLISAVLASQENDLSDIENRLQALKQFQQLSQAQSLASANKRVSNILRKEAENAVINSVDPALFESDAEKSLALLIEEKDKIVRPLFADGKYTEALTELANLQQAVDRFFDEVMVVVDDQKIKNNRLSILAKLRNLFLQVADISLLQTPQ